MKTMPETGRWWTCPSLVMGSAVLLAAGSVAALSTHLFLLGAESRGPALAARLALALMGLCMLLALASLLRCRRLAAELYLAQQEASRRKSERDQAQAELVRHLYQQRRLSRDRAQFEAQLGEYEKLAALTTLALGAAHAINNPLLGILSHLELERQAALGEDPHEVEQCIEGAHRIAATIRSLISYARPDPVRPTRFRLQQLVSDTLVFLAPQPLFRNIELRNQIPVDLPEITADSNQLSQVLLNLLLNAAEAISGPGVITVEAGEVPESHTVEIRVSDTGCGIAAEVQSHIFEPFFTTKRGRGTGLGLSISQAYVRRHGGELTVESTSEEGTTIRIRLPVAAQVEREEHLHLVG